MARNLEIEQDDPLMCEDIHLSDLRHELDRMPVVDKLVHRVQKIGNFVNHAHNEALHIGRHKKFAAFAGAGAVAAVTVGLKRHH